MNLEQFPKTFFTFDQYWWLYLIFVGLVFAMVAIDLVVVNKKNEVISAKEAVIWSIVWFLTALIFLGWFYYYAVGKTTMWYSSHPQVIPQGSTAQIEGAAKGHQFSLEFFTGYILEKVLAVDNIFVFAMVFRYFQVPLRDQHKILFYGIIGAIFFRAIFISIGALLIQYDWVLILFGVFLIFTGLKILFAKEKEEDPADNFVLKFLGKSSYLSPLPMDKIQGRFFIRENGKLLFTTLFLTLLVIEFSDIIFAIDSVPAIFAITREPFIVFTSNIFAILGLRSLYFLLANAVEKFSALKYGLSVILIFIGIKMAWLNKVYGGHFPISISLGVIFGILVACILYSIWKEKRETNQTAN